MKHILAFLSLLLIGCNSIENSQTIVPSNWAFDNNYSDNFDNDFILNGDIKEVIVKYYTFEEKFGERVFTNVDINILKFKYR